MKHFTFLLAAISMSASALTIKIDYTYDTNNFFNTIEKKQAIEAVAKFYGDLVTDNLLRIDAADFSGSSWDAVFKDPQTGVVTSIANLVVPENTIIVYVAARSFSGGTLGEGGPGGASVSGGANFTVWFDRVIGRGNAGALLPFPTDHAPWGGSIAFDLEGPWNFSLSQNGSGFEFVGVALHEMAHVLGIGTANSWTTKCTGGFFTGVASARSYGSNPPVQSGKGHFAQATAASRSFGSFGRTHGISRPVTMIPLITDDGTNFDVLGDLDLAALIDCGWQISPPLKMAVTSLNPSTSSFTWNSSSFLGYQVQRSVDLQTFPDGSSVIAGNGSIQTWADTAPPTSKAFYRLAAASAGTTSALVAQEPTISIARSVATGITTLSYQPKVASGCNGCQH